MSRDPKESSTFGRLLPRWIVNNIVPRQQAHKEGYSMGKDSCQLRDKRSQPNSAINNSSSLGYRTAPFQSREHHTSPSNHARSARTLDKPHSASRSSPGCSTTYPNPGSMTYTSLRRCTMNRPPDRIMNNQADRGQAPRASYPFLTPPASRRDVASWNASNTIGAPQTVLCLNKGEYTSLLRPGCEPSICPARPSSSIPMLSFAEPQHSDSPPAGLVGIQTGTPGRTIATTTPSNQMICQTPTSYPCCSACEPLLNGTHTLLDSCDLIPSGEHQTDSMQNCPQCRMIGANMLSATCCPDNCSLLMDASGQRNTANITNANVGSNTMHMDHSGPLGSGEAEHLTDPQCSTAYMSMQEMLNSCV